MSKDRERFYARFQEDAWNPSVDALKNQRVAIYLRTAVASPNQVTSIELLKKQYEDFLVEHAGWTLAGMYIDEGVPGSHAKDIPNLQRMLADARSGMFDLIITRDIFRLCRNVVDCIDFIRELSALNPPVGVYFFGENIYTLDKRLEKEMLLSLAGRIADKESYWKAEHMTSDHDPRLGRKCDYACHLQFRTSKNKSQGVEQCEKK